MNNISRRNFLRITGIAATAVAINPTETFAQVNGSSENKRQAQFVGPFSLTSLAGRIPNAAKSIWIPSNASNVHSIDDRRGHLGTFIFPSDDGSFAIPEGSKFSTSEQSMRGVFDVDGRVSFKTPQFTIADRDNRHRKINRRVNMEFDVIHAVPELDRLANKDGVKNNRAGFIFLDTHGLAIDRDGVPSKSVSGISGYDDRSDLTILPGTEVRRIQAMYDNFDFVGYANINGQTMKNIAYRQWDGLTDHMKTHGVEPWMYDLGRHVLETQRLAQTPNNPFTTKNEFLAIEAEFRKRLMAHVAQHGKPKSKGEYEQIKRAVKIDIIQDAQNGLLELTPSPAR